jgi:hypothetical protein
MIQHEALDQWNYVAAAYAIGLGGTALLIVQSWLVMRKAEKRREKGREK